MSPEAAGSTGDVVETILGHRFTRQELLREALTHRSAARARGRGHGSNERLEFVGDRVLGLVMAEWLAERFPREQEGDLGRRLAHLVSQPVLAAVAEKIGLDSILSVAPGEARAGVKRRATVLADALEAALGAVYYDAGLEGARAMVRRAWEPAMVAQTEPPKDAKTALQEWAQKHTGDLPSYHVASRSGPPHAPKFAVVVRVGTATGAGTGTSKRSAEQAAAADLLQAVLKAPPRQSAAPAPVPGDPLVVTPSEATRPAAADPATGSPPATHAPATTAESAARENPASPEGPAA